MPDLSEDARIKIAATAVGRELGPLATWERPSLMHEYGANNIDLVDKFAARLQTLRQNVWSKLSSLSDDELRDIESQLNDEFHIGAALWVRQFGREIGYLRQSMPHPVASGFGHPKFAVDINHWGTLPTLNLHEATMVSLGANPEALSEDEVLEATKWSRGKRNWAALEAVVKRREFFGRHFHHTGWGYVAEQTSRIKDWIDRAELEVFPAFYETLVRRHSKPAENTLAEETKSMNSQERETLLKLVAAMACEQYGFDPSRQRSEATRQIREDVELIGHTMDDKTIRKWLKEAAALVQEEYWAKD